MGALELSLAQDAGRAGASQRSDEELDLRDAVVAFRRARRLASADDYRGWLDARGLTTSDVDAHLLRAADHQRAGE